MKKLFYFLTILFMNISIYATDYTEYLNLKIGNVFVYLSYNSEAGRYWNCTSYFLLRVRITDTVLQNSRKYFHFTREYIHISGSCYNSPYMFPFHINGYNLLRLDTANGTIYYYDHAGQCPYIPNEVMIDSLGVQLNDSVKIKCTKKPYSYKCIDTAGNKKFYGNGYGNYGEITREYVRGVGLVGNNHYMGMAGGWILHNQSLKGRVIDGVVYGDTAFPIPVGLVQNGTNGIPDRFELLQNYPNPFNPMTKLKFQMPKSGFVTLKVFDAIGKEVQVLVNQELSPGTYEVDFDGSDLPSGVYYYRLDASTPLSVTYSETRKMVLIK